MINKNKLNSERYLHILEAIINENLSNLCFHPFYIKGRETLYI